jgi:hypothetical protein
LPSKKKYEYLKKTNQWCFQFLILLEIIFVSRKCFGGKYLPFFPKSVKLFRIFDPGARKKKSRTEKKYII